MRRWLWIALAAGAVAAAAAGEAEPPLAPSGDAKTASGIGLLKVQSLMAPEDFRKCGLHKVDKDELAELDKWIGSLVVRIASLVRTPDVPSTGKTSALGFAEIEALEGGLVIASDGKMLGVVSRDKYDPKSLANRYGDYGSRYSAGSILNKYGEYGSQYSQNSPFNRLSTDPPRIFVQGKAAAYLTANTLMTPRVDPLLLLAWLGVER